MSDDAAVLNALLDLKGEVGDVKAEISEVKATGLATLAQAKKTNGRVDQAEDNISRIQTVLAVLKRDEQRDQDDADEERTRASARLSVRIALVSAFAGAVALEGLAALLHIWHLG